MQVDSCPFCGRREIQVLDKENYVYMCSTGHAWKVRGGELIELRKLSKEEALVKIADRIKQFVDELKQLGKTSLVPPLPEVTYADLHSLQEALLALISEGKLEVYIDTCNKINFVLTTNGMTNVL